jgi:dTDP-4-amino-4,6-dideoxygalactose transaminase
MANAPSSNAAAAKPEPIQFIDLQAQRRRIEKEVEAAVIRVVRHGAYIMGPEVGEMEAQLAKMAGVRHVVSCGSGTEALSLPLMALGIGPGDAVLVPSFTFAATAEVVALVGATPVFIDSIADTFNIDVAAIDRAVAKAKAAGLKPKAIIPVDLFGLPADYDPLLEAAKAHKLFVLEDAAQAFGATYKKRPLCGLADAAGTSFFPAKPLGCYGDGGAIFTDDDGLVATLRSLRVHGQGSNKYENVRVGINGRMDTMQCAIVIEKLKIFPDEIVARQRVAERYNRALGNVVKVPRVPEGLTSVWAQYTIVLENRDKVAAALKAKGIPTAVYYPLPLHLQPAYKHYPRSDEKLPVSEELSGKVLSLPMHPYLDEATQDRIIAAVREAVAA